MLEFSSETVLLRITISILRIHLLSGSYHRIDLSIQPAPPQTTSTVPAAQFQIYSYPVSTPPRPRQTHRIKARASSVIWPTSTSSYQGWWCATRVYARVCMVDRQRSEGCAESCEYGGVVHSLQPSQPICRWSVFQTQSTLS